MRLALSHLAACPRTPRKTHSWVSAKGARMTKTVTARQPVGEILTRPAVRGADPGLVPSPLMTLVGVAEYLQVNPRTVRRLVARRALRCVRVASMLRFDLQDVLRFVAARKE